MSIEPHHPDLFWYGIHGCEILFTIMGPGCKTVTREANDRVVGLWADGRQGTFVGQKGYGAEVVGSKKSGSAGSYEGYEPLVIEICKFFQTGTPPVTMEETLEIYTFMEAADASKRAGGKPVSMDEVFQKAVQAQRGRRAGKRLPGQGCDLGAGAAGDTSAVPPHTCDRRIGEVNGTPFLFPIEQPFTVPFAFGQGDSSR